MREWVEAATSTCPHCKGDGWRVCSGCGAHFLSSTSGLLCFDCAHDPEMVEGAGR